MNPRCGIYIITCIQTQRSYVGSSVNVPVRWRNHLMTLRNATHASSTMNKDWTQHGPTGFLWEHVAVCHPEDRIALESVVMDHMNSRVEGYNAQRPGAYKIGWNHSPETRMKQSLVKKGIPNPAARRKRKPLSEERRRQIGDSSRGRKLGPMSEEHKQRLREAKLGVPNPKGAEARRGRKHSEEHKRKIGDAQRGRPGHAHTEETKKRMSEIKKLAGRPMPSTKGTKASEETRRKLSEARKGKPKSESHRLALAAANRARAVREREQKLAKQTTPPSM